MAAEHKGVHHVVLGGGRQQRLLHVAVKEPHPALIPVIFEFSHCLAVLPTGAPVQLLRPLLLPRLSAAHWRQHRREVVHHFEHVLLCPAAAPWRERRANSQV